MGKLPLCPGLRARPSSAKNLTPLASAPPKGHPMYHDSCGCIQQGVVWGEQQGEGVGACVESAGKAPTCPSLEFSRPR